MLLQLYLLHPRADQAAGLHALGSDYQSTFSAVESSAVLEQVTHYISYAVCLECNRLECSPRPLFGAGLRIGVQMLLLPVLQAGPAAAVVMEGRDALRPRLLAAYNAQVRPMLCSCMVI